MSNFIVTIAYQNEQDCDAMLSYVESTANAFLAEEKVLSFPTTVAGPDKIFRNIIPVANTVVGNEFLNTIYVEAKQQNIDVFCSLINSENPDTIPSNPQP